MRQTSMLLAVALVAGACTPTRDNADDPARAPVAVLEIKTLAGAVETVGNVGSRATVFVLDAQKSVDPFNRGDLSYLWDLDGDGTFETSASQACPDTGVVACIIRSFAITTAQLPSGVGVVPIPVSVKAVATSHNHAEATQNVFVSNSAPVLDAGDELTAVVDRQPRLVLDACGGSIATCTTFDPDGDKLHFDWEQIRGESVSLVALDGSNRRMTFSAPLTEQLLTFRVKVTDGLIAQTAQVDVRVGQPTWLITVNPSRLYRIFPEAAARPLEGGIVPVPAGGEINFATALAVDPSNGFVWTAATRRNGTQTLELRVVKTAPDLSVLSTVSVAPPSVGSLGGFVDLAVSNNAACAVLDGGTSRTFARVSGAYASFNPPDGARPWRVLTDPLDPSRCFAITAAHAYELTIATGAFQDVAVANTVPPLFGPDRTNLRFGIAPFAATTTTDGSLWITNGDVLSRFDNGVRTDVTLNPPLTDVRAIVPRRSGGLWAADGENTQLHRIDTTTGLTTEEGVGYFGPYLATGFEVYSFAPSQLTTDPVDGSLWIVDNLDLRVEHFADVNGELVLAGSLPAEEMAGGFAISFDHLSIDSTRGRVAVVGSVANPLGALDDINTIQFIPTHLHRIVDVGVGSGGLSLDPTRGAIWSVFGPEIQRLSSTGRVLARVAVQNTLGGIATAALDADADGGVWVADASDVTHYDEEGQALQHVTLPCKPTRLDGGDAADLCVACTILGSQPRFFRVDQAANTSTELFAAGASQTVFDVRRGNEGTCWFALGRIGPTPARLVRVPPASTAGVNMAIDAFSLHPDPRDNTLWLGARTNPAQFERLNPAGTVTASVPPPPGVPTPTPVPLAIHRKCANAASAACLEVWTTQFQGTQVWRTDSATLTPIETFAIPVGTPARMEIP